MPEKAATFRQEVSAQWAKRICQKLKLKDFKSHSDILGKLKTYRKKVNK